MRQITLGRTGLLAGRNGFGALPIQRTAKAEVVRILHRALDGGINFYDTARLYTDSEEKIGQAFHDRRDKVLLASKTRGQTPRDIFQDLETSLKNLRTDYLDLYQLHWAQKVYAPGDGSGLYEAMLEARAQGKIRFIGLTAHGGDIALGAAESGLYDVIQYPLNYLSSPAELALIDLCRDRNIGLLAMKALSGGMLTNHVDACFAFLHQFGTLLPLWGIQIMEHLEQFLALEAEPPALDAARLALIAEDRAELDKAFCRGCGYCLPCPVNIPINDAARMSLTLNRMRWQDFTTPAWQEKMALCADCIDCGRCARRCPYKLDTPRLIHENWAYYQNFLREKGLA